ncbi:MAG: hypothetical protein HY035_11520 [Nitrospirae bacterium]|nr:hypothetical protein [Nitrospirota bacterium]
MEQGKKSIKKELAKEGIKLVKLSELSKAELAKINLDDLWIMKPDPEMAKKLKARARYCGCRNVCLV